MIHVIILYEGTPKGKSTFVTKTYHFAIEALNILPNFKDSVCPFGSAWVVTKDTSITFGIHQLEFPKNTRLLTESKENIEPAKESPENKISEYYTLSSEHLNNLKKIARLTIGVPQNDRQLLINAISGFFNTSANKKLQSIHSKISPENYVATYLTTTKNILRNINNHKSKISDNAQHIVNFFNFFKHNKATKSILDIDHVEKINKMSVLTTLLSKASEIIFNENKLYEKLSEHSTYYKKVYEKLFNPDEQESDDKILSETNDNIDYFPSRNTIKCIREMKNNFPNTIAAIKSITQITTTAYSLAEFATSLILKQGIENLKIAVHTNPAKFDGNSRSIISILCLTLLNKTVEMTDQLQALFMKDLLTEEDKKTVRDNFEITIEKEQPLFQALLEKLSINGPLFNKYEVNKTTIALTPDPNQLAEKKQKGANIFVALCFHQLHAPDSKDLACYYPKPAKVSNTL